MPALPRYSHYFSCLYDEPEPVGNLGRGTHYSVFRTAEWLDVVRHPLPRPQTHDFAVIWDEDHDTRVIEAVEKLYMAGLLSPVQFIGERKGTLTVIVAARFYWHNTVDIDEYKRRVLEIVQDLDDPWTAQIGSFDRNPGSPQNTFTEGFIHADEHRVEIYLRNIDSLWSLGTRDYEYDDSLVGEPTHTE